MKNTFILFLMITTSAFSQLSEQSGFVSFKYGAGIVDSAFYQSFSLNGEILLKHRFGLNYNLDFIIRNDKVFQIHAPAGILGGPILIGLGIASYSSAGDSDGDGKKDSNFGALGIIGGILVLILPEGVSYHIPLSYRLDLAPYINILGIDFVRNNNTSKNYWRYATSFGAKLNFWQEDKMTFSTFLETRKVAGMGWSLGAGFGLGYTIK